MTYHICLNTTNLSKDNVDSYLKYIHYVLRVLLYGKLMCSFPKQFPLNWPQVRFSLQVAISACGSVYWSVPLRVIVKYAQTVKSNFFVIK